MFKLRINRELSTKT